MNDTKRLFTHPKYRTHRTVIMNEIQSRTAENFEVVQFHTSPFSCVTSSIASKKSKKSVYFIKQMQRLYDEFHDNEYDSSR